MHLDTIQIREASAQNDLGELYHLREILIECSEVMAKLGESRWEAAHFEVSYLEELVRQHQLFVVLVNDKIAGTFKVQHHDSLFWPEMNHEEAVYLHKIALSKSARGRGLTSEIIAWAKSYTSSKNRTFLRLDTDRKRPGLCKLYEGLGFTPHSYKKLDFIEVVRFQMQVS
jgi:GNAT superfamily N-acetyltransferase